MGISPERPPTNGRPPSRANLRSRIRYHFTGNAEGSTLRLTLGCLLADELGLELRRLGGRRLTFAAGEARLSEWLAENARVCWVVCGEPWLVEEEAIAALWLPLNLDQNARHLFHSVLTAMRAEARQRAR